MIAKKASGKSNDLGFSTFVGPETPIKAKNLMKNLDAGNIKVIQSVFQLKL